MMPMVPSYFVARRVFLLFCLASTIPVLGCKTGPLAEYYGLNPFNRPGAEETEYGPAPAVRRQQIREMAASSADLPPQQQVGAARELAMRMQNEPDPLLRAEIVKALGGLPVGPSREALRLAIQDGETNVRIAACGAWQQIGGQEAVAVLSEVIASDTDDDVRLAAARGLGTFESQAAVRGLAIALDDRNPALQLRAMESLKQVSGRDLGHDVVAWRNFVSGGAVQPPSEPSLVERLFDRF